MQPLRLACTLAALGGLSGAACGGPPPAPKPVKAAAEPSRPPPRPTVARDAVLRAALPFYGQRTEDGARLSRVELLGALADADAVCLGESHDDPRHHAAQLAVLSHMAEHAPRAGRRLALGLEMFQRPFQSALESYGRYTAEEDELLSRTEWAKRWGFDFSLYRPLLERAREAGLTLLALNASSETTRKVAREGLDALSPEARRDLPELVLDDKAHRAFFDAAMKHHPMKDRDADRMYLAQVLWDETMAATAARWLTTGAQANQILVLAGMGHCHDAAIVQRIRRRADVRVVGVRPLLASELSQSSTAPLLRFDYDLVLEDVPAP